MFQLAEQEDLVLRVGQLKNELIWQTTRLQQQKDAHHSLTKCEKEQSRSQIGFLQGFAFLDQGLPYQKQYF